MFVVVFLILRLVEELTGYIAMSAELENVSIFENYP